MLAQLQKDGVTSLVCAKPEDGDIHEDVAAERLARALSPTTVAFTRAATGRVNIRTLQRGIIRYDRRLIRQLNEIDEAITFALVQHNQLLDASQMAATLKIIPFFVAESSIIAVENLFVDRAAFSFHALRQCNFRAYSNASCRAKGSVVQRHAKGNRGAPCPAWKPAC
jgi:molybdenum cofactor cytidylyltransferase